MKIYAKHAPYEDGHLGEVVAQMRVLGPPTIKVVRYADELFALEGSHRLAAADYLGMTPIFEELEPDLPDTGWWASIKASLPRYEFNEAG